MSANQLKLILWCAAGFLSSQVLIWIGYAIYLALTGRIYG